MQILCKLSTLTSNLHLSDEFYFFPPLSTEFSATSLDSGHFCLFFSFVPVFRTTFIIGAQIYMYMNDIKIIVLMTKMMWLMLTRRRRMNVDGNSRPFTRPAPPIIDFTKYVADSISWSVNLSIAIGLVCGVHLVKLLCICITFGSVQLFGWRSALWELHLFGLVENGRIN